MKNIKIEKFSNNHVVITNGTTIILQSYDTVVVQKNIKTGSIVLDPYVTGKPSQTTMKNVYAFLESNRKKLFSKIENKEIKVKNLN